MSTQSNFGNSSTRNKVATNPALVASYRVFGSVLQAIETHGPTAMYLPFWQVFQTHLVMNGGGQLRLDAGYQWQKKDCPRSLHFAWEVAKRDGCTLYPVVGTAKLKTVSNHLWQPAAAHRAAYGRWFLGAVAVKDGELSAEERPIMGLVLFDGIGRLLLAGGNIAASAGSLEPSEAVKDLEGSCMFGGRPNFLKDCAKEVQDLVVGAVNGYRAGEAVTAELGFYPGQTWNDGTAAVYDAAAPAEAERHKTFDEIEADMSASEASEIEEAVMASSIEEAGPVETQELVVFAAPVATPVAAPVHDQGLGQLQAERDILATRQKILTVRLAAVSQALSVTTESVVIQGLCAQLETISSEAAKLAAEIAKVGKACVAQG